MDFRDIKGEGPVGINGHFGLVSRAPADFAHSLFVTLPDFGSDQDLEWGPCRWQSRDATTLPAKGDQCLVLFDNNKEPWVVAWWPF